MNVGSNYKSPKVVLLKRLGGARIGTVIGFGKNYTKMLPNLQ